jgi:hypothetical protein
MTLEYGYVKCKVISEPVLRSKRRPQEIQSHLHATRQVATPVDGAENWDTAINVGTNDADDLLQYKLVFDFHHEIRNGLGSATAGSHDLTADSGLPSLDFLRSDFLAETGAWRHSDVMDGTEEPEPVASVKRLLHRAKAMKADVFIFGRVYKTGGPGIPVIHMNQGSGGKYLNDGEADHNDHNDIWQDGAVLVNLGQDGWERGTSPRLRSNTFPRMTLATPSGKVIPSRIPIRGARSSRNFGHLPTQEETPHTIAE